MEVAYRPEAWQTWFAMGGLAAATLTGLSSVGLSIHLRSIVDTPAHLARAREAMVSLIVALVLSILALIPEQGSAALGIELLALSVIVFVVSLRLQSSTLHHLPAHLDNALDRPEQRHGRDHNRGCRPPHAGAGWPAMVGADHLHVPAVAYRQCLESCDPCDGSLLLGARPRAGRYSTTSSIGWPPSASTPSPPSGRSDSRGSTCVFGTSATRWSRAFGSGEWCAR